MVIQIKHNGKIFFLAAKKTRKSPAITPYRRKAWQFTDLNRCKPVRDDVLEFFKDSVICS